MKVEVITRFMDIKEHVMREVGEVFSATADRVHEINSTRYGELVKIVRGKPEKFEEIRSLAPETVEKEPETVKDETETPKE